MEIKLSVRNLVEFVLRSGDIDNSYVSQDRMVQGIRAHQKLQKEYGKAYKAEYFLKNTTEYGGMTFKVQGRADGLITDQNPVIIDEIKSTTRNLESLEDRPIHWAQAKCYAYFYALDFGLDEIGVQLSYYNVDQDQTKRFRKYFSLEDLEEFYHDLILSYLDFSQKLARYREERNKSLVDLDFPFVYRKGQKDLAHAVYKTLYDRVNLFAEAPTGIGKTMSTFFPSLKSMETGLVDKVFYLTARSTTKKQADSAIDILISRGLAIKSVVFTAKDKVCINDKISCNPKDCPYAKGHFDRVNQAIMDTLEGEDRIDKDTIIKRAEENRVCPFELQLDLGNYTDIVICDYNYVFDPRVYLRRFFDSPVEDYVLLVDEAHNLIDRGREMYSASLGSNDLIAIIESFDGDYLPIRKAVSRALTKLEANRPQPKDEGLVLTDPPEDLIRALMALSSKLDPFLAKEKSHDDYDEILDLYFKVSSFLKISDLYDEGYRTLVTEDDEDLVEVKLLCIDTSEKFRTVLERARSSVFFSATLTPMDFFKDLLGGGSADYKYHLESPFDQDKFFLGALSLSTKYKDRPRSVGAICRAIEDLVESKDGNYIVFFPSYAYMDMVYQAFIKDNKDIKTLVQERSMTEDEREDFIGKIRDGEGVLAFAVLGGVFSEGIDLAGQALIGAIIVSVGLPGLSFERNVIRDFFDDKSHQGYPFAYQYPGMNKILQAAGRVIRTEEDRGAALLIDDRYLTRSYRALMPRHWDHIKNYYETESLKEDLEEFWKEEEGV